MIFRVGIVLPALVALLFANSSRAQTPEYPIAIDHVERALADSGATVDRTALLRAYAAYLGAIYPVTRDACAQLAAAGVDSVRIAGRGQRARAIAAMREWRRKSDEFVAAIVPVHSPEAVAARRQMLLAIWSERARVASGASADPFVPIENVGAILACVPEESLAPARAAIGRSIEARTAALARIVLECEDAELEMAREAERLGAAGRVRDELHAGDAADEVHRAIVLANFNQKGVRDAVAAYRKLAVAMAEELLALIPESQRAVRKGRLMHAIFATVSLRVDAPDEFGNRSSGCAQLAMNLLLTSGIPDAAREQVVEGLAELLRFEGDRAWDQAMRRGDGDGSDGLRFGEDAEHAEDILARVRQSIGIERFSGWLLENGLVETVPRDEELAKLGISRAYAEQSLRQVRARVEARRVPEAGAGAAASTAAGAVQLAGLLLGRDASESEQALVRDLLDRVNARIAAEVRPLERAVTEHRAAIAQPKPVAAALDDARAFGQKLREAPVKRAEIEEGFVQEVRAAMGADAAAVAEAMLAASAARDIRAGARMTRFGRMFSDTFGGTPVDLDALALAVDDAAAHAWLRARLVAHGQRLRASAGRVRHDAFALFAAEEAMRIALPALQYGRGDPEPVGAALFEAFPEARNYVRIAIDRSEQPRIRVSPAPLDPLTSATLASLDAWRATEREALASDATAGRAAEDSAATVARAVLRQRFTEAAGKVDDISSRLAMVDGHAECALLAELLAASATRATMSRDHALAVFQSPVDPKAIATEGGLDSQFELRMTSALAATQSLWAEQRFARVAFEVLAPAAVRSDFDRSRK